MKIKHYKKGGALLVSLFTLLILSIIVGSLSIEMTIEGMLLSNKKKRYKAEILAQSGIDFSKAIIEKQNQARQLEINQSNFQDDIDEFMKTALYLKRGLKGSLNLSITNMGNIKINIQSAETGRNINKLDRNQLIEIFEMANIPSTDWNVLIDCLYDWIDEGDLNRLNGAESDDEYYIENGYKVKNSSLDSIEELLLIKHWNEDILYGKKEDQYSEAIYGISDLLTVWGDGKVNLNSASTNLLLSFVEYEDWELSNIMQSRLGLDGIENTIDDGIRSIDEVNADPNKFKLQSDLLIINSIGTCDNIECEIECVVKLQGTIPKIVYWNEKTKTKK